MNNEKREREREEKRINTDKYKEETECERILLGTSLLDEHSSLFFSPFFCPYISFFSKMLAFNVVYEKREDKEKKNGEKYMTTRIERRGERNVMRFDRRRIAYERKTEQDDERTQAERHTGRKK